MRKFAIKIIFLLFPLILKAQNSADIDLSFGDNFNNGSSIEAIAIQNDGKIIVGGTFAAFNGNVQNRLIRLNTDGTKDTSFNIGSGFPAQVYSIVIQPDSKILVGGLFVTFNGVSQKYIVRLNNDGTRDTTFSNGSLFNGASSSQSIKSISLQQDGKILVGGNFSSNNINDLIRLNSNGTLDTTFNIGDGVGLTSGNAGVNSIAVQTDGKIIIGGIFNTFYSSLQYVNNLIRLNSDGSIDTSFNLYNSSTGFNNSIKTIKVQDDGKILVGGNFTTFNNISQKNLIRLNSDGTKDTSFILQGLSFNNNVNTIAIQSDGKIIVGGNFTTYNGSLQPFLIRLLNDGTKDFSFDINNGFNNGVLATALQIDGKILVGGAFSSYNSIQSNFLIRLKGENLLNLANFEKEKIVVYPNPATDILNIKDFKENETVTIINIYGQIIKTFVLKNDKIEINDLKSGIYFLKINNSYLKFIKK